jgi:hypothetical protein
MPNMTHDHSVDVLGLATESGIILLSQDEGPVNDYITSRNALGKPFAPTAVKARREGQNIYEVKSGSSLALAFGAAVNTDYMLTGASVSQTQAGEVTVTVNYIKPSAANMIKSYETYTETINGGTGVVNLFGATSSGGCISSANLTIGMERRESLLATGLDYCAAGIVTLGYRRDVSISSSAAITIPGTGYYTTKPLRTSAGEFDAYTANYYTHPNLAT